jgi:hypothetical protein
MKKNLSFALVLLFFGMISCTNQKETEKNNQNTPGSTMDLKIETLSQESMGSPLMITDETLLVIRNQEELDRLWEHPTSMMEKPDNPSIDFSNHFILVSAMGEMPSSGYSTTIEYLEENEGVLVAHVKNLFPGAGCVNLMVITTPHHIVKINRTDADVRFEVVSEVVDCE